MEQFYFYHSLKELQSLELLVHNSVVWETCLRKIIFQTANEKKSCQLERFEDVAALIFLIEVLCGVHSKVIGETEIFGQFKNFLSTPAGQNISFFQNQKFVQFIFKQVKEIRDKHITGLGVNSYGSLIRKLCQSEDEISIVGYGQLTKKILPWINNRNVRIHVRDKLKYKDQKNIDFRELHENDFHPTVIVAAQLKSEHFVECLKSDIKIHKIIDCRSLEQSEATLKSLVSNQEIVIIDLKDLFASIEAKQDRIKQQLPLIKDEIRARAQAYLLKIQHRPQGWEDLCG